MKFVWALVNKIQLMDVVECRKLSLSPVDNKISLNQSRRLYFRRYIYTIV